MKKVWTAFACAVLGTGCAVDAIDETAADEPVDSTAVAHGAAKPTTFMTAPDPGTSTPFFRSLGTNGRTCGSCHVREEGWAVTPAGMQARFDATAGLDPAFRTNDGANSPLANVASEANRRVAYSMLLTKGLVRVGIGIPANAEFTLESVDDPYGFASTTELSLFRRPLPSTNLKFLSAVMWDGRETSIAQQAIDATMGHAQATGTQPADMDGIVKFESSLFTAVAEDDVAEDLHGDGAKGGPTEINKQQFFIGVNDPLGQNPTGKVFNPRAMTMFKEWDKYLGKTKPRDAKRASIYRGQELFNTKQFTVSGVGGLNDKLGVASLTVTCTTCHDTPNVGNHSVALPLNLGISDGALRSPDMPLYTLRNTTTGAIVQTTDPGRALITGKWADIGKFKGPVLRGVALRPPYFHNGMIGTLEGVVDFYDARFGIGFTVQEKADLVAFLEAI
jgi:cytochrome c peroxidase